MNENYVVVVISFTVFRLSGGLLLNLIDLSLVADTRCRSRSHQTTVGCDHHYDGNDGDRLGTAEQQVPEASRSTGFHGNASEDVNESSNSQKQS